MHVFVFNVRNCPTIAKMEFYYLIQVNSICDQLSLTLDVSNWKKNADSHKFYSILNAHKPYPVHSLPLPHL